jgi:DNA primase large subunit
MALQDLRQSKMMSHLLDALDRGEDIGHYGRVVFVMVGQYFLSDEEVIAQLTKDPDCDEEKARGLLRQVEAKGYNPPKRDRVLAWMDQQEFPICPDPDDQGTCNVYRSLKFPPEVYEKISSYYEDARS